MNIAEQVATYLSDQGIALYNPTGVDSQVYIDALPEKNNIFSVYNRPGGYLGVSLGYRKVGIQVIYRGDTNPITSYSKADEAFAALNGLAGYLVAGQNYIVEVLSQAGGPEGMGTSERDNAHEYTMLFTVEYKS